MSSGLKEKDLALLKAQVTELAKVLKSESDLNDLTQQLVKMTVEAALCAELDDHLIACIDGLNGFPEAIAAECPQTKIQLCLVHMVRNSLKYVVWKDYKAVTAGLKRI